MKLHRVELENWRKHTKRRIDFDDNATIIYGPNETGKSTILEALSKAFFDRSSSHAESIKGVKPRTASGNVTSSVTVEFTLNETRYRVEKNFNLRRGTSLYKVVGNKPVLQAQDDSADEQLIKLLEADLPSSRGSKPSQWGAFRWLWTPQENRELPTDKDGDPTAALHLERGETGGVLVTPKFQDVQNLVQTSCARYFTKTGRAVSGSPISNTEEEIQEHENRRTELADIIDKVEAEKHQLRELEQQLPGLEQKIAATRDELEKAQTEVVDLSAIESKLEASEADVREAKRNVQDSEKAIKELKNSAKEVESLQKKEKKARDNLSRLEAVCEHLEKRQQEAKAEVEEKAMKIRECEELTKDARILWTMADTEKKIKDSNERIRKIDDITTKIEKLSKEEAPVVPTEDEIEKLSNSLARIEALKESLAMRGLTVTVTPGKKGSLQVEVDGKNLEDGRLKDTGAESVSVTAPELGKVDVTADIKQAHDAKVDIKGLQASIQSTLKKYSVKSIDQLKDLSRKQNDISKKIDLLQAERKGIDERTVNEMARELKKLEKILEECKKTERTPNAIKLNSLDGDLAELMNIREQEQEAAKTVLDRARTQRDEVDKEHLEKKQELAGIRAEQKSCSEELEKARAREREVITQHGSVESQEKNLSTANADLTKKNEAYKKIKQRHDELEKGPLNRIKRLKKQIENQDQVIRQQQTSIDQLKGGIAKESLGGAYSELTETESQIEILTERLEKERMRAESFKLLKEALENQYHSALSGVVGPIKDEVKASLSYITRFMHEDVELNEYLFPTRFGERGIDDISLEFNDASSGLKEVLALCVRLAIAKHLSKRDSQCLVLDDPFVHVSTDRSDRVIEKINEAISEHGLQVIVFTHRPMEFSGFTGRMVDIQSDK
ncbi:MAG: SMC family ATPase [Candidatus Aenigmarchaeota archaeon]|nr:SMC family ATPase [Candidatus Aenigmarchaeota archaeon]